MTGTQTVKFQRGNKTITGNVVARGYFNVDQPECFEVSAPEFPHLRFIVPVSECQAK